MSRIATSRYGSDQQLTLPICRRLTEIGASIRQTFEPVIMSHLYPRSEISIYVQVLGSDGGTFRQGILVPSTR